MTVKEMNVFVDKANNIIRKSSKLYTHVDIKIVVKDAENTIFITYINTLHNDDKYIYISNRRMYWKSRLIPFSFLNKFEFKNIDIKIIKH